MPPTDGDNDKLLPSAAPRLCVNNNKITTSSLIIKPAAAGGWQPMPRSCDGCARRFVKRPSASSADSHLLTMLLPPTIRAPIFFFGANSPRFYSWKHKFWTFLSFYFFFLYHKKFCNKLKNTKKGQKNYALGLLLYCHFAGGNSLVEINKVQPRRQF